MSKAVINTLLTADNSKFKAGIRGADASVGGFMRGNLARVAAAVAAAFVVRAVVNFGKQMMATADEIDNLSTRLNLSTNSVQMLQKVADDAGFSFGKFESAIIKSNAAQAEAITENGMMRKSFEKMGISIEELRNLSPEETFKTLSKVMAENGEDMEVLDGYYEIFGKRAGGTLLESMKSLGSEGFDNVTEKMIEQNRIMDQETIKLFDRYEQKLKETEEATKNFFAKALSKTIGGFEYLGRTIKGVVVDNKSFAESSSDAADAIFGVNENLRMLTVEEREARKAAEELAEAEESLADTQERVSEKTKARASEIASLKGELSTLRDEMADVSAQEVDIEIPTITNQQVEIWKKFFEEVVVFSDADVSIDINVPHITMSQVSIWNKFLEMWRYAQANVKVDLNVPHMTNQQVRIWKTFFDALTAAGLQNVSFGFDTLTNARMAEIKTFYQELSNIGGGLSFEVPESGLMFGDIDFSSFSTDIKILATGVSELAKMKGIHWI